MNKTYRYLLLLLWCIILLLVFLFYVILGVVHIKYENYFLCTCFYGDVIDCTESGMKPYMTDEDVFPNITCSQPGDFSDNVTVLFNPCHPDMDRPDELMCYVIEERLEIVHCDMNRMNQTKGDMVIMHDTLTYRIHEIKLHYELLGVLAIVIFIFFFCTCCCWAVKGRKAIMQAINTKKDEMSGTTKDDYSKLSKIDPHELKVLQQSAEDEEFLEN